MASAAERLLKLKDEIEQAKLDKASISGVIAQNLQRLKSEYSCRTLDSAKAELELLEEKKSEITHQIAAAVADLEEKYEW